MYKKVNWVSI